MLYIVTRSIDQGRTAGIVSVLGVQVGTLLHVVAAALGASALLASSALAFTIVKYLGAAYLLYLGARKLLGHDQSQGLQMNGPRSLGRHFSQGVIVNLLNPKTALFFFAFLPQFVDPSKGAVGAQILFLGAIFVALGTCTDGLYAVLAGTMGHWLRGNIRFVRAQRYVAGSVYIGLGVPAALSGAQEGP